MNQAESNQSEEVAEHLFNFRGYQKMLWLPFFFGGPVVGLGCFLIGLVAVAIVYGVAGTAGVMETLLQMVLEGWLLGVVPAVIEGWLLGVVPAVLTGVAAALLRLVKGWRGSMLMAAIGAVLSFAVGGLMPQWNEYSILFAPAGALSALLFSIWLPERGTVSRSREAA